MGIRARPLPEYGVTVTTFSGRVGLQQLQRYIGALETTYTGRWLTYFDPTVDLSELDVASIPELKRALADKLRELHGDDPVISALVWGTGADDVFLRFWTSYVGGDAAYPAEPASFSSLEAACAWLELPEDARRAVVEAVESLQDPQDGSEARALADAEPANRA